MATKVLIDEVSSNGRSRVLDLGCICDTNIRFFTGLGCSVFVDDILQLNTQIPHRSRITDADGLNRLLDALNYPANFFDGILCWNIFDHLDPSLAQRLSHTLWTLLKISGCAVALFRPDGAGSANGVLRYRILKQDELLYESLPLPPLEGKPYQNRDIATLLAPLSLANSYRLKNGWREVVLRK